MNDSKEEIKSLLTDESTNVDHLETPAVAQNVDMELPTPVKKKKKKRSVT